MDPTRTVSELKASFIRTQVRILSESLEPAENWRAYAVETEADDLSDKVVEDVMQKGAVECCTFDCYMLYGLRLRLTWKSKCDIEAA